MDDKKIRVVIVDDSVVICRLMNQILSMDPAIEVMGTAEDGAEAIDLVCQEEPDVVTMDVNMPNMNGFEATKRIMSTHPVPIVIVSGAWSPKDQSDTFDVMKTGAVAYLDKPKGLGHPRFHECAQELIGIVKSLAGIKVKARKYVDGGFGETKTQRPVPRPGRVNAEVIAIGVSTGGPPVLQAILSKLPADYPIPIVIAQHITSGFTDALVSWLSTTVAMPVSVAKEGDKIKSGRIYIAQGGNHMRVNKGGIIELFEPDLPQKACPSVSELFDSVSKVYGKNAVGVLLTGMGRDGAEELKMLKDLGALTLAQDKESSVVHGMPGEAIKLGGAVHVLNPGEIAEMLCGLPAKAGTR